MMFSLSSTPLEDIQLRKLFACGQAGALNCFEGRVRNFNDGKNVIALEYEAQEEICKSEMVKIFDEVKKRYNVIDAKCFHRTGKLKVGDMAVWIGVISAHRDDSFKASRYIIDEIKKRLPIWKKEYYLNGESKWVECSHTDSSVDFNENEYYARQLALEEIGLKGQETLKNSKVLVVGVGGLGCSALASLATSGIGQLGICEFDSVDVANLHRQNLYTYQDVGKLKVEVAYERLKALNPSVKINTYSQKLTVDNINTLVPMYDCVVDCTDNFITKFMINDACYLSNVPLVQSSIYQYEGHLRVFIPNKTGCLRCIWPEVPDSNCIGNCQEAGVVAMVPNIFGNLQAWETIRLLLGLENGLAGKTLVMNLLNYKTSILRENKNSQCPICGENATVSSLSQSLYEISHDYVITITDDNWTKVKKAQFIDIREESEQIINPIRNIDYISYPLSRFCEEPYKFDNDQTYIIVCLKGIRSQKLTESLRNDGLTNVFSLKDGIFTLNSYSDPSYV